MHTFIYYIFRMYISYKAVYFKKARQCVLYSKLDKTTLIADSISPPCYIGLQIRLAARTLVTAPSSVFLFFGTGVLRAGGTDGPMRLNLILRYHPVKLPRQRRQHDALRRLVFGYNARSLTTVAVQGDFYCSRSTVVRVGHPLDHKLYPSPSPGRARVARG